MFRCEMFNRWCMPTIVLAALVTLSVSTARSATPEVRDSAHTFDAAALDQVNSIVKQIKEKHGKDLTIATFESIPDAQKARFSASTKDDFYEHWLRQEARESETNGVFILIVKDPGRLQIGVGNATRIKNFTDRDRDELREVMLAKFRDKQFDEGLIEGAKFVLERMDKNSGMPATPATPATSHPSTSAPATQSAPATGPVTSSTSPASEPSTKPDSSEKPDLSKSTAPAPSGTDVKPADSATPEAASKPDSSRKAEGDKAQSSPKPDSDVKSSPPGTVESGK